MATELIDLDELVAPPKRVKLGGEVYTLPAQLPVPLYLRLRADEKAYAEALERGEGDWDERLTDLNELLLDLFRIHQPDIESLPAGIVQLFTVIPQVYGASSVVEDEDDDEAPKATRARGKSSTTNRKTSKSRSSTS